VVRRSWDRGCKGHRILRRVLVGGRHLRTSRAIGFHEQVVTATLASSSRRQRRERDSSVTELETSAGRQSEGAASAAEEGDATEVSEAWSEQAPWEENAHALAFTPRTRGGAGRGAKKGSACLAPIRRSVLECREALGPSIKSHEAQDFVPRASGASKRGDVHAVKAAE